MGQMDRQTDRQMGKMQNVAYRMAALVSNYYLLFLFNLTTFPERLG